MTTFLYLIVAAVIGWVATELMHDRSNLLINIVVAVVGAFLAGYFLSPSSRSGHQRCDHRSNHAGHTSGDVILLAIIHLFRGRGRRWAR